MNATPQAALVEALPPLPEQRHFPGWAPIVYYTADETRAYGEACARAAIAQAEAAQPVAPFCEVTVSEADGFRRADVRWLRAEGLNALPLGLSRLYAAPRPAEAAQVEAQPVLFMSPKQLQAIKNPLDPSDDSGTYLPIRKTPAGKFTLPLYAAPQPAEAAPKQEAHADDAAVDVFAAAMKEKLALARAKGRGGWQTCSPESLSEMLRDHVEKGDPRDVANFCAFLWSLGAGITAPLPGSEAFDRWVNAGMGVRREAAPMQEAVLLPEKEIRDIANGLNGLPHSLGQWQRDLAVARAVEAKVCAALSAQPQQPAPVPVAREPLNERQMLDCVRSVGTPAPMGLTRDRGPYEITEPTWFLSQLVRAIERAHGISTPQTPATPGDEGTEGRA